MEHVLHLRIIITDLVSKLLGRYDRIILTPADGGFLLILERKIGLNVSCLLIRRVIMVSNNKSCN